MTAIFPPSWIKIFVKAEEKTDEVLVKKRRSRVSTFFVEKKIKTKSTTRCCKHSTGEYKRGVDWRNPRILVVDRLIGQLHFRINFRKDLNAFRSVT